LLEPVETDAVAPAVGVATAADQLDLGTKRAVVAHDRDQGPRRLRDEKVANEADTARGGIGRRGLDGFLLALVDEHEHARPLDLRAEVPPPQPHEVHAIDNRPSVVY